MESSIPAGGRIEGPEEPHGVGAAEPHHYVNYYLIFLLLVVLTVVTVAVAQYRFHNELINVLVALAVATTKAVFVARYFMHLKFEGKLIHLILFVPLSLAVILALALIPDIGFGRTTDFNDVVGMFEHMVHAVVGGNAQ